LQWHVEQRNDWYIASDVILSLSKVILSLSKDILSLSNVILSLSKDNDADADDVRPRSANDADHLANRKSGRYDVFHDEHAVVAIDFKTAAQRRDSNFLFDEDEARSELFSHLVGKHDAADCGAGN